MERIRNLNRYQKAILLILAAMFVFFTVIYAAVTSRVGFSYHGSILVPAEENGNTVYSGKIYGQESVFTVTSDKTVTYRYGNYNYGPYTVREDPTAVPEKYAYDNSAIGAEIRQGDKILFRGGVIKSGSGWMFYDENGTWYGLGTVLYSSNGVMYDAEGNVVDHLEPSAVTIWELANGPELTRKGSWVVWFLGLFASVFTSVTILFADEMFRFSMYFRIERACEAEPSEWEIASRYISWTLLPMIVLGIYILGLRQF